MPSTSFPAETGDPGRYAGRGRRLERSLRRGMEAVALVLVSLSPWAFGSVQPVYELAIDAGVAALLVLWGARILLEWRFSWKKCPVALCLAGLFLLGVWQMTPLPRPV